jgi:hypothetical protein
MTKFFYFYKSKRYLLTLQFKITKYLLFKKG